MKNNFKQIREDRGLTIDILASVTGFSAERLNAIESETANPTLDELNGLSKFYGLKITDFYTRQSTTANPVEQNNANPIANEPELDLSQAQVVNSDNTIKNPQPQAINNQNVQQQNQSPYPNYAYPNNAPYPQQQYGPQQYGPQQYGPQYPQNNAYQQPKPDKYQKNPKTINIILLILTALAAICFFVLPIASGSSYFGTVTVTFFNYLTSRDGGYVVLGVFYLISLLLILVYTIMSMTKNKVAKNDVTLTVFKIMSFSASFVLFIMAMIMIFNTGFTGITIVSLALVLAIVVLAIVSFVKSGKIEDLNAYNLQEQTNKIKKQSATKYQTKKAFPIVNIVLLAIMIVLLIIELNNYNFRLYSYDYGVVSLIFTICVLVFNILFLIKKIACTLFAKISKIFITVIMIIPPILLLVANYITTEAVIICVVSSVAVIVLTIIDIIKSKKIVEQQ